jgi:hypothetical protein
VSCRQLVGWLFFKDTADRNIHKHTMTQFISLLEEDGLSLLVSARQCIVPYSKWNNVLTGRFLVIILLPRPPDITTLDFRFTHIPGVKKWYWIWSFKHNFSNAIWCLRKHGEKVCAYM